MSVELTELTVFQDSINLNTPSYIDIANIGGTLFAYVGSNVSSTLTVFRIETSGDLTVVQTLTHDVNLPLAGAIGATVFENNGQEMLFVTTQDEGVSTFDIGSDGTLSLVSTVTEVFAPFLSFTQARATIIDIDGSIYAFVPGTAENAVTVFDIFSDGLLSVSDTFSDNPSIPLKGAFDSVAVRKDGDQYLVVSGLLENGLTVFSVDLDGELVVTDSIVDNTGLELAGAAGVAALEVGGRAFVYAAGLNDAGLQVLELEAGGLTPVSGLP